MIKIYGSASGFMWGRTVYTDYPSGCLRKIYLSAKGVRDPIDEKHSIRGALNEDTYEKDLQAGRHQYQREYKVTGPLHFASNAIFSGRVDFLVSNGECNEVHELKSSESKSRLSAIKKGEWVTDNLAQTVAYMDQIGTAVGKLEYSYWQQKNGEYERLLQKSLNVTIDITGRILVDNVPTKFSVHDLYMHQYQAVRVQEQDIIWDRPHNYDLLWGSPCKFCPFADACDKYDKNELEGADAFVQYAQTILSKGESNEHNSEV